MNISNPKPPSKPNRYNVRILSRASDGTLVVLELADVPKALWVKHLGTKLLTTIGSNVVGEAIGAGAVDDEDDDGADDGAEPLMTPDDLSSLLGIARRSIYNMVSLGQIPAPIRIGRRLRFDPIVIRRWVATLPARGGRHPFGAGN